MDRFKKYVMRIASIVLSAAIVITLGESAAVKAASKYVKDLTVSSEKVVLTGEGAKIVVQAKVATSGKASKKVSVTSSDSSVATVWVSKVSKGTTDITITSWTGGECVVTVKTKGKDASGKKLTRKIKVVVGAESPGQEESTHDDESKSKAEAGKNGANNSNEDGKNETNNGGKAGKDEKAMADEKVVVTVTSETFSGKYAVKNDSTGKTDVLEANDLTRKYISFAPWPTTVAQVEYIIKNYSDPYVIAALFVVAADNYEKGKDMNDRSPVTFAMIEAINTGAGILDGSAYKLDNFAVGRINVNYGMGRVVVDGGSTVDVRDFAPRAYMKGATPENNYTPAGGSDKTKWQIVVDEYVYNGDIDNGYITVCPQRYSMEQDTETAKPVYIEHNQVLRIGFRRHKATGIWVPTPVSALSGEVSGNVKPFDISSTGLVSNNSVPPVIDQGF